MTDLDNSSSGMHRGVVLALDAQGASNFTAWKKALGTRFVGAGGSTAQYYWKFLDKPFDP